MLILCDRFRADFSSGQVIKLKNIFDEWLPHGKSSIGFEDLKEARPGHTVSGLLSVHNVLFKLHN